MLDKTKRYLIVGLGLLGGKYALELTKAGFAVYATVERSDLSGFNWSQVPVVLVETGFMSNPDEDVKLSKPAYRAKLMRALANGIEAYFGARQLFIPPAP